MVGEILKRIIRWIREQMRKWREWRKQWGLWIEQLKPRHTLPTSI